MFFLSSFLKIFHGIFCCSIKFSYFYREERKSFIRAKYIDKAFIQPYYSSTRELYSELEQAIDSHNLADLLQCFAEGTHLGVELTDSLPNSVSSSYGNNYSISVLAYNSLKYLKT
jgi:hypothetical protein